jgi:Flp pilus assembly protein TadG
MHRFVRDSRGVSAVEFALVLPLMLTLYIGGAEVSQALSANRKVTLVSRTIADLTAQSSSITSGRMTDFLNASAAIMYPFAASNLKVTVSCVAIDSAGRATIKWSETLNGTKQATGASVTLPGALNVRSTSLLWSEAQYAYTPTIGYVISGTTNLRDQMYMSPRIAAPTYGTTTC